MVYLLKRRCYIEASAFRTVVCIPGPTGWPDLRGQEMQAAFLFVPTGFCDRPPYRSWMSAGERRGPSSDACHPKRTELPNPETRSFHSRESRQLSDATHTSGDQPSIGKGAGADHLTVEHLICTVHSIQQARCPQGREWVVTPRAHGDERMHTDPGDQALTPPRGSTDPAQPSLFGPPPRARNTDPDTSHEAAASMADEAHNQRQAVHTLLREHGALTADRIDELIGWRITTAGRRLPELLEAGRVRRLATRGLTRSNRQAHLWESVG